MRINFKYSCILLLLVSLVLSFSTKPAQSAIDLSGGDSGEPIPINATNASDVIELNSVIEYTNKLEFSPDSSTLASAAFERRIRLWHVPDLELMDTSDRTSGTLYTITYSPDGDLLATGSGDSNIRIWDSKDLSLIRTIEGHLYDVFSLDFSPD